MCSKAVTNGQGKTAYPKKCKSREGEERYKKNRATNSKKERIRTSAHLPLNYDGHSKFLARSFVQSFVQS